MLLKKMDMRAYNSWKITLNHAKIWREIRLKALLTQLLGKNVFWACFIPYLRWYEVQEFNEGFKYKYESGSIRFLFSSPWSDHSYSIKSVQK